MQKDKREETCPVCDQPALLEEGEQTYRCGQGHGWGELGAPSQAAKELTQEYNRSMCRHSDPHRNSLCATLHDVSTTSQNQGRSDVAFGARLTHSCGILLLVWGSLATDVLRRQQQMHTDDLTNDALRWGGLVQETANDHDCNDLDSQKDPKDTALSFDTMLAMIAERLL